LIAKWAVERPELITIDGRDFATLEEFYGVIARAIISPNHSGSGNLDWLNDILSWPCGAWMAPYTLVWRNAEESGRRLGHGETVRQLEQRKVPRFPFGDSKAVSDINAARHGKGPTVFDWLIEVIERNGEYVKLRLE
jgi:RNAse (barnase) inhibitor barstar